jgi:hypothetical protein
MIIPLGAGEENFNFSVPTSARRPSSLNEELPAWLSDGLCRLATGGSFAVRQLYTDDDEVLFQAARPLLVNRIEDVISRPDLADRSIFLTVPPVADARRQSEQELWRQFELARPRILGALLDLVVQGYVDCPASA